MAVTFAKENELAAALLKGDESAKQQYLKVYGADLKKVCGALLGPRDTQAEALIQQVLNQGISELDGFDFNNLIKTRLEQLCVGQCFTLLRERQADLAKQDMELATILKLELYTEGPLHKAINQTQREKLHQAYEKLGKKQRQISEMRDLQGLSFGAVARALNEPVGAVQTQLLSARKALIQIIRTAQGQQNG